jgi:hypothetical protein
MRRDRQAPLIVLPEGANCCDGILLVGADRLPLQQPTIVGTRAWWTAWGRRNLVETANGALHGGFIEIDKGYVQLLDSGRIDGPLAHGLAGYNRWVMRQWKRIDRQLPADDPDALPPEVAPRKPRRGRVVRYEDVPGLGHGPPRTK